MSDDPSDLVRVYVWQMPVRIAHWLIAGSIAILAITGYYIGHPFITVTGPARDHFVMGWVKVIHFYTAYVFIAAVTMRIVWMFSGNKYAHWDKFVPVHASRRRGLWPSLKFYLFMQPKPPGFVGHNPLAGSMYVLVFALYFVAIFTGLMMHGASADVSAPVRWFASWAPLVGGLQTVRWIHHVDMWLILGFVVNHVYSSVLMSVVESNATLDSIFSGYKVVPRGQLQFSRYRFLNRRGQVDE